MPEDHRAARSRDGASAAAAPPRPSGEEADREAGAGPGAGADAGTGARTGAGTGAGGSIDAILARIAAEADRRRAGEAAHAPGAADWQRRHGQVRPRARAAGLIAELSEKGGAATLPADAPRYHISQFLSLTDSAFLTSAYRVVLGRAPDRSGHDALTAALASGAASRAQVLSGLMRSPEGRGRSVRIDGLARRRLLDVAMRLPVVGGLVAPFVSLATLRADMAATARRLSAIDERQDRMIDTLRRTLLEIDLAARTAGETAEAARAESDRASATMEAHRTMLVERAGALAALIEEMRAGAGQAEGGPAEGRQAEGGAADGLAALDAHALDELYVALENRFRGSTEEIAARSRRYLPAIRQLAPVRAGLPVVDIGCGRGEWLSQLAERGVTVRGIDLNHAMAEAARAAGHTVTTGDALTALRAMADDSVGAVTGFHIIEHLPFKVLVALFDEVRRVLAPQGAVLFETPNPECLVVGAYSFHLDPTHRAPLPPEFTRFLAEARGLTPVRIVRGDADLDLERAESGFAPKEITDWFQAPMDYALLAFKPGPDGPRAAGAPA